MIEQAYTQANQLGLDVWCEDEAGLFQTAPVAGTSWQPEGQPACHAHKYVRNGTAKLVTLLHPRDGQVRVKGVRQCTNEVLLPWLRAELQAIVDALSPAPELPASERRALWDRWEAGLKIPLMRSQEPPALRLLLILDNLAGHKNYEFVRWSYAHGIMLLYTPLRGRG